MRKMAYILPALFGAVAVLSYASAQTGSKTDKDTTKDKKDYSNAPIVQKMMAFNKKKDGKLTREELTDKRLHRLFDEADANQDGVVTAEELTALVEKMAAQDKKQGGGPGSMAH